MLLSTNNDFNATNNDKDPKLKLIIICKHHIVGILLQKFTFKFDWKRFLLLEKLKSPLLWTYIYVIDDRNGKESFAILYEMSYKRKIKQSNKKVHNL